MQITFNQHVKDEYIIATRLKYVSTAGEIRVADASRASVIQESGLAMVEARKSGRAQIITAVHIGGLNDRQTPGFVGALKRARIVYADGIAVVLLARLSGARFIQRSPTTEIGTSIIAEVSLILGRPAKIALVGGKRGLAEHAAMALDKDSVDIVFSTHGYHTELEWERVLFDLRTSRPDVVLLGLGSPRELIFADSNRQALPPAIILTCGGWFGFLAGEESRAPLILQTLGLEWVSRLVQSPRRLGSRYVIGSFVFARAALQILLSRVKSRP